MRPQRAPPGYLLALDTAADLCTVALAGAQGVVQVQGEPGRTHLEHVMPLLHRLLASRGLRPADCAAYAFGAGPGSFTGLRIACTLVQGLAYACGRKIVAVGNLEALASKAIADAGCVSGRLALPSAGRILAIIDARLGQCYWALYGYGPVDPLSLVAIAPPALIDGPTLPELLERWQPDCVAGDPALLDTLPLPPGLRRLAAAADAATIAHLAGVAVAADRVLAPALAAPLYVRDRVAATVAQRQAARTAQLP